MMIDYQLFFGFPLVSSLKVQLDQTLPHLRALYIQNHPDYLQQVEHENTLYLGKYVGDLIELQKLEQLQSHIYSLLNCLITSHYDQQRLVLLAIPNLSLSEEHLKPSSKSDHL